MRATITLSRETEALARRLADARRIPVDAAVREALEASVRAAGVEALRQTRMTEAEFAARRARIDSIVAEIAALPVLDPRSPQEIADDLNEP